MTQKFNDVFGELRSAGEARDVRLIYEAIDRLRKLDFERYEDELYDHAMQYLLESNAMSYATTKRLEEIRQWVIDQLESTDTDSGVDVKRQLWFLVQGKRCDIRWLGRCDAIKHAHNKGLVTRNDIKDMVWLILKERNIDEPDDSYTWNT